MESLTSTARSPPEPLARAGLFAQPPREDRSFFETALAFALGKTGDNIPAFPAGLYPAPASVDLVYAAVPNVEWTSSFWTGMLWLAFEATGEARFREAATAQLGDYRRRLDERMEVDTHDLGFLYSLSCVPAWKLLGDREARAVALLAADLLLARFLPKAGIIQAWGDLANPGERGRAIIDCAMNLPLLHWASAETGNPHYRASAVSHIARTDASLVRHDWSTYHTYWYDVDSGAPLRGSTVQGHADDSCWSRGQAWGLYGNALSFGSTGDRTGLEIARGLARYFLNRLPDDLVARWDLCLTAGDGERDSSAAAIAAAGLLELSSRLPALDPDRRPFENAALHILASLARDYTSAAEPRSNGILLHATYSRPKGRGVDECCVWGDYYYVEALVRALRGWEPWW